MLGEYRALDPNPNIEDRVMAWVSFYDKTKETRGGGDEILLGRFPSGNGGGLQRPVPRTEPQRDFLRFSRKPCGER